MDGKIDLLARMRSLHGAGLDPVTNRKAKLFELRSRVDSFNDGDANFGLKYVQVCIVMWKGFSGAVMGCRQWPAC
jgi:hypothetical protein